MSVKRRTVRERAMQVLYAHEMSGGPIERTLTDILGDMSKKDPETYQFARELILKTVQERKTLDGLMEKQIAHWEFERLALIDTIIIRIAICEFLYFDEIPPKVTMNEAIEIARRFSTERSDSFVNGVLDAVLSELKKAGKLKKIGRGLVDLPSRKKKEA